MNMFPNFYIVLPEIFMLSMIGIVLLAEVFFRRPLITYALTQLTLIGAGILTALSLSSPAMITFDGMFIADPVSQVCKLCIYAVSLFAFLYARPYIQVREIPKGEYYLLGLTAVLGMMVLCSAHHLLTLFLGIELLSLPLYAMVALCRTSSLGSEAAMKYFVMGALTSAMLLYGMSLLYGATKSCDITQIAHVLATTPVQYNLIFIVGLVFIVVGLAFKFGAAPFHLWVPDVYQGAPTSVTLFVGSVPKIAALAMTVRLLVEAMPSLNIEWQQMLMVVALFSIALGNMVAIVQNNVKRMLAYSAIAHIGYMLLGVIAATPRGYAAALFYIVVYAVMVAGAFGVLVVLSRAGFEAEWFEDLRGLNERNAWYAFMMLIIMFSMAGIPPGVGFFAKLGVLDALIQVHLVWMAVYALVFSIIGAYYYLRVVKMMYFEAAEDHTPLVVPRDMQIALSVNGLLVLGLGLFPTALVHFCRLAFGLN